MLQPVYKEKQEIRRAGSQPIISSNVHFHDEVKQREEIVVAHVGILGCSNSDTALGSIDVEATFQHEVCGLKAQVFNDSSY